MEPEFAIVNGTLVTESSLIANATVRIKNGRIEKISESQAELSRTVDVRGAYICPGFIDLHVHGMGGYDSTEATHTALYGLCEALPRYGVTTVVPTLLSSPDKVTHAFLDTMKSAASAQQTGAKIVGAHLEGPFLNPSHRGVHLQENLRAPSIETLNDFTNGYFGLIKIMTLAPELNGALEVIRECRGIGIIPAMGHTNATYDQAIAGIEAGITHSTHTFNAMSGIEVRDPGALGAVLSSQRVYAEIIADGIHVHPSNVRLL
ncbi:MAG TPA: N-acetylglucosamine-6-phosphate deacetylase, partial [Candidatus Acidoferrales bacterium]|nr:N-acetylglucosamine-6-phosphate deacetylase [Candidatus Acidoferrales bacterium]